MSLDLSERERLVRDIGDMNVTILRNHGLLTSGRTVAEAWVKMYFLEKACSAQLKLLAATASGARIHHPTREVCEHTARQYAQGECGKREWPALLRQLDEAGIEYAV